MKLPELVAEHFWAYVDQDQVLTNYKDEDLKRLALMLEDSKLSFMMSKPAHDYTFEDELTITQMFAKIHARVRRARDGLDRRLLAPQISQSTSIVQDQRSPGIVARLMGRK